MKLKIFVYHYIHFINLFIKQKHCAQTTFSFVIRMYVKLKCVKSKNRDTIQVAYYNKSVFITRINYYFGQIIRANLVLIFFYKINFCIVNKMRHLYMNNKYIFFRIWISEYNIKYKSITSNYYAPFSLSFIVRFPKAVLIEKSLGSNVVHGIYQLLISKTALQFENQLGTLNKLIQE
ncbi:hypothetical protein AGLY_001847 [Aphis glycines]|uniref:Uncharacterized protein n=1 Tax=Aphis glycines TaxID=307491 RepID=A0A6G0U5H2_APHGL|nr:hypothetical protein AGLY_001847 [Aphis glycines]